MLDGNEREEEIDDQILFNVSTTPLIVLLQCFASWLSMCKVEMALINISSSN